MWKELSKLEKAGLVIGSIECVAGFTIAMYAHIKCKQQAKEIQDLNNAIDADMEYINELTKGVTNTEELKNQLFED